MLWAAERGEVSTRTVVTLALVYHGVVLLLPLLLSRDVFSYAFYGRILSQYGHNPYVSTPADFPANDLSRFVWPGWRDTPSVYGPVFVWLAAAITAVFRGMVDVIEAFRSWRWRRAWGRSGSWCGSWAACARSARPTPRP